MLFRGFSRRNITLLRRAYTTYVRPVLEYASNVWNPICSNMLMLLKGFSIISPSEITVLRNLSHGKRFACLKLDTLECRRLRQTSYFTTKSCTTSLRYFDMSMHSRHTRLTECIGDFHISASFCRTVAYQNIFFHRCVLCRNNLPSTVTSATSLK